MMVTPESKATASMLKEIKLFNFLSDENLEQILKLGTAITYEPHTNIIIEGELSWGLYLIIDGLVGVLKTNKLTGTSYDLGQLHSGSFFGEMSLVDEDPRSATVRTLTTCTVFYISKESFLNFLNQSNELKLNFYTNCIHNLVSRLRELDDNFVISQYQLWHNALKKEDDEA